MKTAVVLAPLALGLATTADASTITVGADGTFSTIQLGIDAALILGGAVVRVEAGSYDENLVLNMSSGAITVSGGWDSTFTTQNHDPAVTSISGGLTDRVLDATLTGGVFTIDDFLILGGEAADRGGGMRLVLSNSAVAQAVQCNYTFNIVQAPAANALGGAIYAELHDGSEFVLDTDKVVSNSVTVAGASAIAYGGGVFVNASDTSQAFVLNSLIGQNVAAATDATSFAYAGGIDMSLANSAKATFTNNHVTANSVQASGANHSFFAGGFFSAGCDGTCRFVASQAIFDQNSGSGAAQFSLGMGGPGSPSASINDTLISRGTGNGAQVQMDAGTANLVNLTVADNAGEGLYLVPNSTITLYNTIAFGNGGDLSVQGTAQQGNNLVGVDPHFVDASAGNFRLLGNSPARDVGDDTPPGGLPAQDLDGDARVFGAHVDIGAYEIGDEIFADGFQ